MRYLLVAGLAGLLAGCSTLGYQSTTVTLPRESLVSELVRLKTKCEDKKIDPAACKLLAKDFATLETALAAPGSVDVQALFGKVLSTLITSGAIGGL